MPIENKSKQKFETTEIYKISEQVLNEWVLSTARMPKNFKYNFGSQINESALALACTIAKVYIIKDIDLKLKNYKN